LSNTLQHAVRLGIIVALAFSIAACETKPSGETGNYYLDVLSKREPKILKAHPQIAKRDGGRLLINLQGGGTIKFDDSLTCLDSECFRYTLYRYDPSEEIVVVWLEAYESYGVVMVDRRNGATLGIPGAPGLSPNRKYWAAAEYNVEDGSGDAVIVRRDTDGLKIEASGLGSGFSQYGCSYAGWIDAVSVRLMCLQDNLEIFDEVVVTRSSDGRWLPARTGRSVAENDLKLPPEN
jgi:hypothetical protein